MPWMGIYEDGCFCILDDTIQEQFGYEREDGPAPRPLFSPCLSVARTWLLDSLVSEAQLHPEQGSEPLLTTAALLHGNRALTSVILILGPGTRGSYKVTLSTSEHP